MRSRTLLWWGTGMLVAATLLGAAIVFGYTEPPGFDTWWNDTISASRSDWMLSFALLLDHIGGGWVAILLVPMLVIIALLIARRWQAAVFAAVAFLVSAGAVQLLKHLFGRARPEDMIVASDFGSFPSGHAANAATIAMVLWLVFPRMWTAILGIAWVVAMAVSRTLLSVHWATDTLGGALVGAGVVLVLGAWLLPWVTRSRRDDPAVTSVG
ncbi:phospholipid phosphatase [Microbacterium sp. Leaf161]|uniref:phosphatase PAP2 family protein n=1 Tax=Microbacterium sp. Leaf161 TaxID=1736281 RepID=UPI0006FE0B0F|nr:phosphatase PAP2 family protein [Microbacterium sp. Leaf161]KQR47729.1 phospholipid phosphatase [Microbacterium sp. Leaf161]